MPIIRMPLLAAKNMAAALLPHVSAEAWHGNSLRCVTFEPGGQYAFATDRYTVGRYDLTNIATEWSDTERMHVPPEVLSAILTLGPKTLMHPLLNYEVLIEVGVNPRVPENSSRRFEAALKVYYKPEEDAARELQYLRVWQAQDQTQRVPPLGPLFDQWVVGEEWSNIAVFDPYHVSKFTGYAKRQREYVRITLTSTERPVKGALIEVGARLKGILMPISFYADDAFGVDLNAVNTERIAAESKPTDTTEAQTDGE